MLSPTDKAKIIDDFVTWSGGLRPNMVPLISDDPTEVTISRYYQAMQTSLPQRRIVVEFINEFRASNA